MKENIVFIPESYVRTALRSYSGCYRTLIKNHLHSRQDRSLTHILHHERFIIPLFFQINMLYDVLCWWILVKITLNAYASI